MFCPEVAIAHSPSEVKLDYDLSAQTLRATITHTRFSDSHYINKVEIRKNGNLVNLQEYKSQPSETFTYSYKVTAVAGDTLEVKAYCNKFGSKTEKLAVGQPGKPVPK
jgi:desulfoferrodoxin (superoxide reductase-like protein)